MKTFSELGRGGMAKTYRYIMGQHVSPLFSSYAVIILDS